MFPFLLESERPRTDPHAATPGVRVACLANGKCWFFPGGTPELAMALARMNLYDGTLDHRRTEIAFGEKRGAGWKELQVLKAVPEGTV